MEKKTPEQLAGEYMEGIDFSNNTGIYIVNEMQGTAFQGFLDGYNSRNDALENLKAALKESSNLIKYMLEEGGFGSLNQSIYNQAANQMSDIDKLLKGD